MARVFSYRGKSLEELQKLTNDEFTKLVKAGERRAIKRMGMKFKSLVIKVDKIKKSGSTKVVKTHIRDAVIFPSWIGMNFAVYSGKEFKALEIRPDMVGHRLGEFVFSTKRVLHSAPGIRATRGSKFLAVK